MSGLTISSDPWGDLGGALGISADSSYDQPRTVSTVPTNALQSMQPVEDSRAGNDWLDWGRATLTGLLGYAVQRDAVRNGVQPAAQTPVPAPNYAQAQAAAQASTTRMLVIGGVAAVALVAVILIAKKA